MARPFRNGGGALRSSLYGRQLALAALALLAALSVIAVEARRAAPAAPAPVGESYRALAAPGRAGVAPGKPTACGVLVDPATEGIVNAVLPCGVRLELHYRGRSVVASVIAHARAPAGREFVLTAPLAARLGLSGLRTVGWSYAAPD